MVFLMCCTDGKKEKEVTLRMLIIATEYLGLQKPWDNYSILRKGEF